MQTPVDRLRECYDAWNRDESLDAVLEQVDPEIEFQAFRDESPEGRTFYHGHDGVRRWAESIAEAWEEIRFVPVEFIEAGDHVLVVVSTQSVGRGSGVAWEDTLGHLWTLGPDGKAIRFELFGDVAEARRVLERAAASSVSDG